MNWRRDGDYFLRGGSPAHGSHIRIELQRGDTLLKVDWPIEAAADCSAWLRDVTK